MLTCHLHIFFVKVSLLWPIFKLDDCFYVVEFEGSLYILEKTQPQGTRSSLSQGSRPPSPVFRQIQQLRRSGKRLWKRERLRVS